MDVVLLILAGMCLIVGIIGCIVPGLPGVPVAYAGLWIAQASERVDFSWQMLLIWGIVTVVVSVLDYIVPALERQLAEEVSGGSFYPGAVISRRGIGHSS